MDESDRERLEYDAAVEVVRSLTDIRFKLLALVPTLAGAVVVLVSAERSAVELLAIGLLGATATVGVLVYELRNSQIRNAAAVRVRAFEERTFAAGPLAVPPRGLGPVRVGHTLGVALVYGAALAGWGYLVAWGLLRALDVGDARSVGLVLGAAAGIAAAVGILRFESHRPTPEPSAPAARPV